MSIGRQVLGVIEAKIAEVGHQVAVLGRTASELSERLTHQLEQRDIAYRGLARVYLPTLDAEAIEQSLAERQEALRNILEVVEAAGGTAQDITRLTWLVQ